MVPRMAKRQKLLQGQNQKAPGGLKRVLYIRYEEALVEPLARLQKRRSRAAGVELSVNDVVRAVLWEACRAPVRARKAPAGSQELTTIQRRLVEEGSSNA